MTYDAHNEQLLLHHIRPDLVCIGGTVVRYWELNAFFHADGLLAVNRGCEDDTPQMIARRFEADAAQLSPRRCLYMTGNHVLTKLDGDIWTCDPPADAQAVYEEILTGARQAVDAARARGIALLLCSLLPEDWTDFGQAAQKRALLKRANEGLSTLARAENIAWLDCYAMFADESGRMSRRCSDDGVTLNHCGYQILYQAVSEWIAAVQGGTSSGVHD